MNEIPTWQDLEQLSLYDPFIRNTVIMVRKGLSREEALIITVITLSKVRAEMLDREIERLQNLVRDR